MLSCMLIIVYVFYCIFYIVTLVDSTCLSRFQDNNNCWKIKWLMENLLSNLIQCLVWFLHYSDERWVSYAFVSTMLLICECRMTWFMIFFLPHSSVEKVLKSHAGIYALFLMSLTLCMKFLLFILHVEIPNHSNYA